MLSSTKELRSLVSKAQEATKDLDNDLRRVAFERVLNHLLESRTAGVAVQNRDASSEITETINNKADGVLADEQQRIDALARYFKISPEEVRYIFDTSEEQPKLMLATKHLAKAKAHATQEITLLIAGALTALGQQTTTSHIRNVADDYDRLDGPNFMAALGKMPGISVLGRPGSQNRIVRMKVTGAEAAQTLAQRIVS